MIRRIIAVGLIASQFATPASAAFGDDQFYFRYKTKILVTDNGQEPIEFAAFNAYGSYENLNAWADQPKLEIALRDTNAGNHAYKNGATWELISGALPPGITSRVSPDTDTLSFSGYATEEGTYPNIVYRVRDKNGKEVQSDPITFEVGPRSEFWLYAWPGETRDINARTDDANLRVSAANLALAQPITESGWKVEGTLPSGISYGIDERGLTFSGTADVAGSYSGIKVTGTDLSGATASLDIVFNVLAPITTSNDNGNEQVLNARTEMASLVTSVRSRATNLPYTDGATWSLVSGELPPGITATPSPDGSTLTYAGYATGEGTFDNIVWMVTDTLGNTLLSAPVRFVIEAREPLTLSASPNPAPYLYQDEDIDLTVVADNLAFDQQLTAEDWEVQGTLPDGIGTSFVNGNLVFTGAPTSKGVYNDIVVTATDAARDTASIDITIAVDADLVAINEGDKVQMLSQNTSAATGGVVARHAQTEEEFTEGLTWTLVSGILPPGITAEFNSSESRLSYVGFPSEQGRWNDIVWEVADGSGNTARTRPITFEVGPPAAISLVTSDGRQIDAETVSGMATDNGTYAVSAINLPNGEPLESDAWSVSGEMPDGITYSVEAGSLKFSGIPTKIGEYPVTVTAVTSDGQSASASLNWSVTNGLTSVASSSFQHLKQYSDVANIRQEIRVKSTDTLYTSGNLVWNLSSGRLPPGVEAVPSEDGSILQFKGYPTEVGTWNNIIYSVTDINGNVLHTQRVGFEVEERDPFTLEANSRRRYMQVNEQALAVTVTATDMAKGETIDLEDWNVQGELPPGVDYIVNGNVMTISGTPTATGTFDGIVISATDSSGQNAVVPISFVVQDQPPSDIYDKSTVYNERLTQYTGQTRMETRLYQGFWSSPVSNSNIQFELVSGTLPPGITAVKQPWGIDYNGYPTEIGSWNDIVWEVTDTLGRKMTTNPVSFTVTNRLPLELSANKTLPLAIRTVSDDAALVISASNLANGIGVAPSDWKVIGNLPSGVSYAAENGNLKFSGIPKYVGNYDVKVSAKDSEGGAATLDIRFQVSNGLGTVNLGVHTTPLKAFSTAAQTTTVVKVLSTNATYSGQVTWTQLSGTIPPGITVSETSSGLAYTGYPTEVGQYENIVWKGVDTSGNSFTTKPVSFKVEPKQDITLTSNKGSSPVFDTATDGQLTVTASNTAFNAGIASGNWSLIGELPDGMTMNQTASGAVIVGKPRIVGTYPVTIKATDNIGGTGEITLTIRVDNGLEVRQIGGSSVTLSQWSQAFNGSSVLSEIKTGSPYLNEATTWQMISGTLPSGITATVSPDKSAVRYSGVATESGTFSDIVWRATDAFGNSVESKPLKLQVNARDQLSLVRSGTTDIRTVSGMPYDPRYIRIGASNYAAGGISPSNWTISGLPEGLNYSSSGAYLLISGTPKKTGDYPITVTAKDSVGQQASLNFTLTVINGLTAAHYNAVSEAINQYGSAPQTNLYALNTVANAIHYNGNLTWEQVSGTLPPGISLAPLADGSTMKFGGSATTAGTFDNIVFRVTDPNGNSFLTQPFAFTVTALPNLTLSSSTPVREGLVNTTFSATVAAENLSPGDILTSDNWSVTGLPSGISYVVDNNRLVFSGKPDTVGTHVAHITITDRLGRSTNFDLTFKVFGGYNVEKVVNGFSSSPSISYSAYSAPVDVIVQLVDAETGVPYRGQADWQLTNGTAVNGVSVTQEDGFVHLLGYAADVTGNRTYIWNVMLPDGNQIEAKLSFNVSSKPALSLKSTGATQYGGREFSRNFTVSNGAYGQPILPEDWTVTGLPEGTSYRTDETGLYIEGTIMKAGSYPIQIGATDAAGFTGTMNYTLTIATPFNLIPNYSSFTWQRWTQKVDYIVMISLNQGSSGYFQGDATLSMVSGSIPAGLTIERDPTRPGYIVASGYPTQTGTFNSRWRQTDSYGNTAEADIKIYINERTALSWSTRTYATTMKVGTAGTFGTFSVNNVALGQVLTASNWTVTGLPAGVTPSVVNGTLTLSGTPTTAGTKSVSVKVTDAGGGTLTQNYSVTVSP